jgi:chromosome segregation ATPase
MSLIDIETHRDFCLLHDLTFTPATGTLNDKVNKSSEELESSLSEINDLTRERSEILADIVTKGEEIQSLSGQVGTLSTERSDLIATLAVKESELITVSFLTLVCSSSLSI